MKDALREAALAWTRQKQGRDDPIFSIIGLAKAGPRESSVGHDEIYDGD